MKGRMERLVPAGVDYRQELRWIGAGLAASFLYSLSFLIYLINRYNGLFIVVGREKVLIEGAVMPDFVEVLNGSLAGFPIVALSMLAVFGYHYLYHYQGGRSIYLMRRLPDRWELWRRCLTLPVLSAMAALLLAALVLLLYFGVYLLVTPEACLTPGQWHKIWTFYLGV